MLAKLETSPGELVYTTRTLISKDGATYIMY